MPNQIENLPAFPIDHSSLNGLTKLEFFTGMALISLKNPNYTAEDMARISVEIAKAVIKELENKK